MKKRSRITAGAIPDLELAEIIQMISLGRKTARLTVNATHGEGEVWFLEGQAVHASVSELSGPAAFYKILEWQTGRFFMEHEITCGDRTIDKDTMLLLMEALQLRDERDGERTNRRQGKDDTSHNRDARVPRKLLVGASVAATIVLGGAAVGSLFETTPLEEAAGETPAIAMPPSTDTLSPPVFELPRSGLLETGESVHVGGPLAAAPGDAAPDESAPRPLVDEPQAPPPQANTQSVECASLDPPVDLLPAEPANERLAMEEHAGVDAQSGTAQAPSYLHLHTRSLVKRGTLVLLVDGEEVHRRELVSESRGVKRLFKRVTGRAAREFEDQITLPAGSHELVARLVRPNRPERESAINLDLESGGVEELKLLLGRSAGKGVVWSPSEETPEPRTQREAGSVADPDAVESETSSTVSVTPSGGTHSSAELAEGTGKNEPKNR